MPTRIILADDHDMIRSGLRALLELDPQMQVIAEAKTGASAVRLAEEMQPDVVVMDVGMPDLNGIEATRRITGASGDGNHNRSGSRAGPSVVALSARSDEHAVQEMFRAGASAYVVKDAVFEELSNAVKLAAAHETYMSPSIARVVLDDYARQTRGPSTLAAAAATKQPPAFAALTSREREILQLLAEGKATKQAAAHLNVSVKTVETHRRNIMQKLDMYSVAELTKYAIRQGLTTIEA